MKIKRKTIQRRFISEVFDAGKEHHISAERMFEIVSRKHPMIGRATIYRNLAAMAEDGMLQRNEVPGGPDCFDTKMHSHYHFRCGDCRNVYDVDMECIADEELLGKIKDKHGFQIDGYVLAFRGKCQKCQEKKQKKTVTPPKSEPPVESVITVETTTVETEVVEPTASV